jgi:hypothetical protein
MRSERLRLFEGENMTPFDQGVPSTGTAIDWSVPKHPKGQTLYTDNYIVAKVNGMQQLLTSAQLQQHLIAGDEVEMVPLP